MPKFRDIIRDFFTPDSAEVSLGFLKAKYSDSARADIRKVLSALRGRRVLLAQMEHEIWEYVFKSLHELRDIFVKLSGDLSTESSNEVRNTVDYLTDIVTAYLSEHEASYIRFMSGPCYPGMSVPHKERNWPELGEAAKDLLRLRSMVFGAARRLNAFVEGFDLEDFPLTESHMASFWVNYAKNRKLCKKCGFNMYYAYEGICPICFPNKVPEWMQNNYGKA